MHPSVEDYKSLFFNDLMPFMDMLAQRHLEMDFQNWIEMVNRIASSIESNPEQYLGRDLPKHEIISKVIKEIFDDFAQEYSIAEDTVSI
jgi:hypothetical protein